MAEIKDIEYIEKRHLHRIDEKGIKYWVCEDVGELIRCKDCKHYVEELCWNLYGRCVTVSDMDYCSCGEKRDNDDTNIDERKEDSEE